MVIPEIYRSSTTPKDASSTTARGYGFSHQKTRRRLIAKHVDGSPCWWCGLPLYGDRKKSMNWDGRALAADHSGESASSGGVADQLLHFNCNSQRQDGRNDDVRPVITGRSPWESLDFSYRNRVEVDEGSSFVDDGDPVFIW